MYKEYFGLPTPIPDISQNRLGNKHMLLDLNGLLLYRKNEIKTKIYSLWKHWSSEKMTGVCEIVTTTMCT